MAIQAAFIEEELPCMLTDDELQSRGRMLCETIWQIDDTEAARTEAMKGFKQRLTGLNETQRKLAKVIRDRIETRMVRCVVRYHVPAEGAKRVMRTDTGEVVREEPMTDAEKQLNLFAAQAEFEQFMAREGIAPAEGETPKPPEDSDEIGEKPNE